MPTLPDVTTQAQLRAQALTHWSSQQLGASGWPPSKGPWRTEPGTLMSVVWPTAGMQSKATLQEKVELGGWLRVA